jgi:hypothetical protein
LNEAESAESVVLTGRRETAACHIWKRKLGGVKGTWEHWNASVTLAREAQSKEHLLDCLERIHGLYKEADLAARGRETEPEITELRRQGVRPYPA